MILAGFPFPFPSQPGQPQPPSLVAALADPTSSNRPSSDRRPLRQPSSQYHRPLVAPSGLSDTQRQFHDHISPFRRQDCQDAEFQIASRRPSLILQPRFQRSLFTFRRLSMLHQLDLKSVQCPSHWPCLRSPPLPFFKHLTHCSHHDLFSFRLFLFFLFSRLSDFIQSCFLLVSHSFFSIRCPRSQVYSPTPKRNPLFNPLTRGAEEETTTFAITPSFRTD
jgi:hypothetical protein